LTDYRQQSPIVKGFYKKTAVFATLPGVFMVQPRVSRWRTTVIARQPGVPEAKSAVFMFLPGDFATIAADKGLMSSGNLFLSGGN
jgi:hypothetical protein